ncbi:lasso peptide biosynthesis PqqD family chaperone [Bacillus suaedae]|uniref:Lasso peptide biosynthesis PqqD family chaperone n=1 Tax=Halalkalibacter suaedae TaxID=2822140 RepID=A0A940WW06_9BACI|nr:lasso peptide biosynthesis PqqD family chaperone [Bacillus suaedae]MBP3951502.1 lasso peptide biosynthesis PqqD family chaperone [Bacillus suaedae]
MIKNQVITMNTGIKQSAGNIVSDMDGEKVMLSIHNGKYYNLGELGGEIWELVKEPTLVRDIVTTLQSHYEVESSICQEQVITFLSQLIDEGLMEIDTP